MVREIILMITNARDDSVEVKWVITFWLFDWKYFFFAGKVIDFLNSEIKL